MHTRFVLGPAGSGKTFLCLAEIRSALEASSDGLPLILLAPKQSTFQLERQLLSDPSLPGYTRLHILSFERMAEFVLGKSQKLATEFLSEEGRVMVLRALLAKRRDNLRLFCASARLPGFAQQLSLLLRDLQNNNVTPDRLDALAAQAGKSSLLKFKLHDLGLMLRNYLDWMRQHNLQDADSRLAAATDVLREIQAKPGAKADLTNPIDDSVTETSTQTAPFRIEGLWLDGFAEMTPQELDLLAALIPLCKEATLAFCVEADVRDNVSWISTWAQVSRIYQQCYERVSALPERSIKVEILRRDYAKSRFKDSPALQRLERFWSQPQPMPPQQSAEVISSPNASNSNSPIASAIRMVVCANPEAEAVLGAREILRFVRGGGRYRDCAVMLRQFAGYNDIISKIFGRYEIPFFLDRRESVAHHPLAELARYALRMAAFGWQHEDWFGALKTGLVTSDEASMDTLENEALARGWRGTAWSEPLKIVDNPALEKRLESLRKDIVPPFLQLAIDLGARVSVGKGTVAEGSQRQESISPETEATPTGAQLAQALGKFLRRLKVEQQLGAWDNFAQENTTAETWTSRLPSLHATVWQQMLLWLENLVVAFQSEPQSISDWLPIIEAGLAGLTVGVVPPALDQVLVGTVDRSRNPDLKLAVVLGMNESVFPAAPALGGLLSESDKSELEARGIRVGPSLREQLGRERYYGYIACTRARQRLVLTCAARDNNEQPLNPSPFFAHIKRLFPSVEIETDSGHWPLTDCEHHIELAAKLLANEAAGAPVAELEDLAAMPALARFNERRRELAAYSPKDSLQPQSTEQLYGGSLRISVTRLEEFAACPFKFFIRSGLRAEERELFELDARAQGSFMHAVLARFHQDVRAQNMQWRDLTPAEASDRINRIASELGHSFSDGLFKASPQNLFAMRYLTEAIKDFIETVVSWMTQYEFNPTAVELAFGGNDAQLPACELDLGEGHRLALAGKIDRIDLWADPQTGSALCVVIDYKSGWQQLDPVLLQHGIQMQLPAYLNVLRRLPDASFWFKLNSVIPVGVFYVNLRGRYSSGANRNEVISNARQVRQEAYQHRGRFDVAAIGQLDSRPGVLKGSQFKFQLTKDDRKPYKSCRDAMLSRDFLEMLDNTEKLLQQMGKDIYAGIAKVDPYRKGNCIACDACQYRPICRIEPWTHPYRILTAGSEPDNTHHL